MNKCLRCGLPALSALLLIAGCSLVSVTLLINLDVQGTHRSTSSNVAMIAVDLTQDQDFKDNKDKIASVDEVGFIFRAQNNIQQGATGQIYMSEVPVVPQTAATIIGSGLAKRVLSGLTLTPGGYVTITYEQSLALEENTDYLHRLVKSGHFYLYGVADTSTFDLTIDQLTVVAVITAEQ
jgi:hypothetical protein